MSGDTPLRCECVHSQEHSNTRIQGYVTRAAAFSPRQLVIRVTQERRSSFRWQRSLQQRSSLWRFSLPGTDALPPPPCPNHLPHTSRPHFPPQAARPRPGALRRGRPAAGSAAAPHEAVQLPGQRPPRRPPVVPASLTTVGGGGVAALVCPFRPARVFSLVPFDCCPRHAVFCGIFPSFQ